MGAIRNVFVVMTCAVTVLGTAASADAAETIGSDLSRAPLNSAPPNLAQTQKTPPIGSTLPVLVGSAGVITKLRLKHGATGLNPGTMAFRILTGSPSTYIARSHPRLPDLPGPVGVPAGVIDIVPKDGAGNPQGVPVSAGERVAIARTSGNFADWPYLAFNLSDDGATNATTPIPNTGDPALGWVTQDDFELMLQYTVEPDADGDGYGDETQDLCLGVAGAACAPCSQATLLGTSGNDVIVGTPGRDVIATSAGNDTVVGLGGNDVICGGDGNDTLKGGSGNDKLFGETGSDLLKGGGGPKDVCKGGPGIDRARKCERVRTL